MHTHSFDRLCCRADNPEESINNVLTPLHRFNPALGIRSGSYWSSKGSYEEASDEWLLLGLAHPVCLVSAVGVWPFLAFFQRVRLSQCLDKIPCLLDLENSTGLQSLAVWDVDPAPFVAMNWRMRFHGTRLHQLVKVLLAQDLLQKLQDPLHLSLRALHDLFFQVYHSMASKGWILSLTSCILRCPRNIHPWLHMGVVCRVPQSTPPRPCASCSLPQKTLEEPLRMQQGTLVCVCTPPYVTTSANLIRSRFHCTAKGILTKEGMRQTDCEQPLSAMADP